LDSGIGPARGAKRPSPLHPRAAAQFRAALFPSGVKDDPLDADLLLDLLVQHRRHLRRLDRYSNVVELQAFSGIAPVTQRSGKSQWVHFRWACPKFLRQTFHEWAAHSIPYSVWARAYYQQQIAKGNDHHAAVRSLAFKWIRIAFRCWKDRVPYNESIYLAALRRRGSALAAAVANPVNR
jgi:hypothetical protein